MRKLYSSLIATAMIFQAAGGSAQEATNSMREAQASGKLSPAGPPLEPPLRVAAGDACIVDLKQAYSISGSLEGSLVLDYRILVAGPCGSPIGTFDEDWIAHGAFEGTLRGSPASAKMSYTAHVAAGGEVEGRIVLGQGLHGMLRVRGNFADGSLSYEGHANEGVAASSDAAPPETRPLPMSIGEELDP